MSFPTVGSFIHTRGPHMFSAINTLIKISRLDPIRKTFSTYEMHRNTFVHCKKVDRKIKNLIVREAQPTISAIRYFKGQNAIEQHLGLKSPTSTFTLDLKSAKSRSSQCVGSFPTSVRTTWRRQRGTERKKERTIRAWRFLKMWFESNHVKHGEKCECLVIEKWYCIRILQEYKLHSSTCTWIFICYTNINLRKYT